MESDHCHDLDDDRQERDEKKRKKAMQKLIVATALSFLFMVGEVVGESGKLRSRLNRDRIKIQTT